MSAAAPRKDFFVSYTGVDQGWAEWIAFVLEERNLNVVVQAWDFRPGSNFVVEMQRAAEGAARTIMVLSPDYLKSVFATPEWAAAFAQDPQGLERKVLPVLVRPCQPQGMLRALVHIDLTGLDEGTASERLVEGVASGRAKPTTRPVFPGSSAGEARPAFPGRGSAQTASAIPDWEAAAASPRAALYIPDMRGAPSDLEKRRFMKEAFEAIVAYFEIAVSEVAAAHRHVDVELQRESASEFTAEIFQGGTSVAFCRVWRGTELGSDGIAYAEGRGMSRGSHNEMLSVAAGRSELRLQALMGAFAFGRMPAGLDVKSLTRDQAAEYLWHRFAGRLER